MHGLCPQCPRSAQRPGTCKRDITTERVQTPAAGEGEGLQQVVREAPLEGPPGLEPGEGPQGDIQSCRPVRLEGVREAQAV